MQASPPRLLVLALPLPPQTLKNRSHTHIYYSLITMQTTKDQLHQVTPHHTQVWLQCMQMPQCTPQDALSFVNRIRPVLNHPLTHSSQTLLMLAASISSINLVKAALHFQPHIHLKDSIGRTALHYAAAVGSL